MPSLFRFLTVVGLLGGLAYGGVYWLAKFVEPQPREIVVTIPADKLYRHR
jgi:hypothetical protein